MLANLISDRMEQLVRIFPWHVRKFGGTLLGKSATDVRTSIEPVAKVSECTKRTEQATN